MRELSDLLRRCAIPLFALVVFADASSAQTPPSRWRRDGGLVLRPIGANENEARFEGYLAVPENRAIEGGRQIQLHVVIVPARAANPKPDPIFYLAGGPGAAATESAALFAGNWMREDRDVVLVDQRGTGGSNALRVQLPGSDENPGGYLAWMFDPERFRAALPELEKQADLKCYTTPIAMTDLDAVREALGFEVVDLVGGSYGTRAALVYMRQFPSRVRAAVLDGVAPIAFENPLHHARSAQESFDRLAEECASDPRTREPYPDLHTDLARVLERFEKGPIDLEVPRPGAAPCKVRLTREAFCDALRFLLYYADGNRRVPSLLRKASEGDLGAFAAVALEQKRALNEALCMGLLMCVTAAEDLPRITEDEIEKECAGTFLGDARVRDQLAIGAFWPHGDVGADYARPVAVDVPTLLLSGTHDAVTPPRWGAEAASHLPHGLHVVVHGCHGVAGHPRVAKLVREFLDRGSIEGLDLEGLDDVRMPGIALPDDRRASRR